jgi:hypothetical protein
MAERVSRAWGATTVRLDPSWRKEMHRSGTVVGSKVYECWDGAEEVYWAGRGEGVRVRRDKAVQAQRCQ